MSKKSNKRKKRVQAQKRNINNKKLNEKVEIKNEDVKKKPIKKQKTKKNSKKEKKKKQVKEISIKNKRIRRAIFIIIIALLVVLIYLLARPKFKDITIELGTKQISVDDFLVSKIYSMGASQVTDISSLDLTKVGEQEVELKFINKPQKVKLKIVDTTAPKVKFKDFSAYVDYQIDPNDFIKSKEDFSEMTVTAQNKPDVSQYGDYKIKINVSDKYGNTTSKTVKLTITWLYDKVSIELGSDFSVANIVVDSERFGNLVDPNEIAKVDTNKLGTYEIQASDENKTYTCIVTVQDTTPPDLQLKDIEIWDDQTLAGGYKDFIVSATDVSGEVKTESSTEIKYGVLGEQVITITATDVNGNKQEKTCKLTIKKDTTGPVIYGLSTLTVNKHTPIDFNNGVYAIDDKNGNCEVTSDGSKVNVDAYGTYYATYTSVDLSGNKTVTSRRINVNHDQEDVNNKINEFYYNYCAGQDPVSIATQVRNKIKYSSNGGGQDPIWYGLTQGSGNCYVHAMIMQTMLQKNGYQSRLIWLPDGSHYWNLVFYNGVWRHIDGTPSSNHTLGLLTDSQKAADAGLHGKMWDTSLWPAAE